MEIIDYILRALFSLIDVLIAWGIEKTYILISQVSTLMVSSGVIKEFAARVNIFLGLFMLFWLALRCISYAVEPDKFTDEQQGFSKISKNVFIMLLMLVLVNYVFTFAYKIQDELLGINSGSNTMLKLIFGNTYVSSAKTNEDIAMRLPLYLYNSFLEPNAGSIKSCKYMINGDDAVKEKCVKMLDSIDGDVAALYSNAFTTTGVSSLLSLTVVTKKSNSGEFLFTYRYLISTICGGMMLIMMISVAIDIAIRIFKLAILQLIAPIPIISYIDPKSGSDGIFKKWLSSCLSTYASIFVKLFSVYFATYMIILVSTAETSIVHINGKEFDFTKNPLVTVLLVLGALQFAKQFPKLINEIFGIELGGGTFGAIAKGTGKGLKKGGRFALGVGKTGAKAAGAAALAGAGGLVANGAAIFNRNKQLRDQLAKGEITNDQFKKRHMGLAKGLGSIVAGGGSAALRGAAHGATSKDGILKSAGAGLQGSNVARNSRDSYQDAGYNIGNRMRDAFDEKAGIQNKYGGYGSMDERIHKEEKEMNEALARAESYRDYAANIASSNSEYSLSDYQKYYEDYSKYTGPLSMQGWIAKQDPSGSPRSQKAHKAMEQYINAQSEASKQETIADTNKQKLNKDKQAYASRTENNGHGHGGK